MSGCASTKTWFLWFSTLNEFSTVLTTCFLSLRLEVFCSLNLAGLWLQDSSYRLPLWGPPPQHNPLLPCSQEDADWMVVRSLIVFPLWGIMTVYDNEDCQYRGWWPFRCGHCWGVFKVPISGQIFFTPSLAGRDGSYPWNLIDLFYASPEARVSFLPLPSCCLNCFPNNPRAETLGFGSCPRPGSPLEPSSLGAGVILCLRNGKLRCCRTTGKLRVGACVGEIEGVWVRACDEDHREDSGGKLAES